MLVNFEGDRRPVHRCPAPGAGTTRTSSRSATAAARRPSTAREFSLWAEMAAPLIASTNVTTLSPIALARSTRTANVIAVDQDPLGTQGVPISSAGGLWVLTKPLQDGDRAVALFNSTNTAADDHHQRQRPPGCRGRRLPPADLWSDAVTETGGQISAFVPGARRGDVPGEPVDRRRARGLCAAHGAVARPGDSGTRLRDAPRLVRETFANDGIVPVKRLKLSLRRARGLAAQAAGPARAVRAPAGRTAVHGRVPRHRTRRRAAARARELAGAATYDPPQAGSAAVGDPRRAGLGAGAGAVRDRRSPPISARVRRPDGAFAISARGNRACSRLSNAPATGTPTRRSTSPARPARPSTAQVTVTSDQAGGCGGGAGLIERDR